MADIEITSTSEQGFVTESRIDDFKLTVDATGEEGPDPNATLAADYASCWVPAFRVGAEQRGHDDLGRVDVEVAADLDDDEDLQDIDFHVSVEKDVDDDVLDEVVDRAHDICHVDAAIRDDLRADVTVEGDAF